jgi:hypothetical protein
MVDISRLPARAPRSFITQQRKQLLQEVSALIARLINATKVL